MLKQLSDTLLKLRPLGGSECFVRYEGAHYADPDYFARVIEHDRQQMHDIKRENVQQRRRINDLLNEIHALKDALKPFAGEGRKNTPDVHQQSVAGHSVV